MPGTPPTTPRLGIARFATTDPDQVPTDLNTVSDRIDVIAGRFESGLLASRPSTGAGAGIADRFYYATDEGVLYRDAGGASPTWSAVNPRSIPTVTSLPASPYDGQIIDYLADSTLGIVWRFRYRTASLSSFKWEAVGEQKPLRPSTARVSTFQSVSAAAGSWGDLATAGPDVTVPLAGDYAVEYGALLQASGLAGQQMLAAVAVGAGTTPTTWPAEIVNPSAGTLIASVEATDQLTGLTASQLLRMRYEAVNSNAGAGAANRWLKVRPDRVG